MSYIDYMSIGVKKLYSVNGHILQSIHPLDKISWELEELRQSWRWQWMGRCGEGRAGRRSRAEGKRVERVAAGGEGVGEVGDLREGEGERGGRRGEECGERGEEEEALGDPEQLEAEHQFHLDQTAFK